MDCTGAGKAGFEAVYEEYYDRIYKYAYTLLLNREEAEDVTADTFLAAWENFGSYDASRASVRTWLARIVHNRAVDLMRSAERGRTVCQEPADVPSAGDFTIGVDDSQTVMWLFSRLKPEEREILNMRYVMDLCDSEIALMLGLEKKTVNKRMQRLLAKCRDILNGKPCLRSGM